MELSWTTFALEIINFLILVWILERFLYKPILNVIERRRAMIKKTMSEAEALKADAEDLQTQYEGRIDAWNKERQQARDDLAREIETEKNARLAKIRNDLKQEQEKVKVAEDRRRVGEQRKMESLALDQAARFATRLLELGSGPDTQKRLVELLLSELTTLSPERLSHLRNHHGFGTEAVSVTSAFQIDEDQQKRLVKTLESVTQTELNPAFAIDSELLAGVRITIGAWILSANLRDELQGFSELARNE